MEQKKIIWKKLAFKAGLMLLAAVISEIVVFNFRSLQSLFYQESSYKDYRYYVTGVTEYEDDTYSFQSEEDHVLHIENIDREVKNIRLDIEVLNSIPLNFLQDNVCKAVILARDEGNAIPYELAKHTVVYNIEASKYIWCGMYGDTKSLEISMTLPNGYLVKIHDITLNAKRPLLFSVTRCMILFFILLTLYLFRPASLLWKRDCVKLERWQQAICFLYGIGVITVLCFPLLNNDLITYSENYAQYKELARALDAGQTHMLFLPPEELVTMENPYDTYLRDEIVGDEIWDYSYYDGKFYVYFGILPCLVFYLPMYHFMGLDMPNTIPIICCGILFGVGLFMLLKALMNRYFKKAPFALLILLSVAGCFGCQIPEFFNRTMIYHVPLAMAMALTVWGLYFWIVSAKDPEKLSPGKMIAGSVCMALVAACRPNIVIYSFLAIPIFWSYRRKKDAAKNIALLLAPYVAVAAGLMYYNVIRFGSVFEFGAVYNLTSFDLLHQRFTLDKAVLAVEYFLLKLPRFQAKFPYLSYTGLEGNPFGHGSIYIEQIYAGLLAANPILWTIPVLFGAKSRKEKKEMVPFCAASLVCIAVSVFLSAQVGGISYRYIADFSPLSFVLAAMAACILLERAADTEREGALKRLIVAACAVSVLMGISILFIQDSKFALYNGNTELFYRIFYGFNFW